MVLDHPSVLLLPGPVGAQTAPQAPRPPPLQDPKHPETLTLRRRGAVVGDAPWLGPQTALEGRPPALMEVGAEGRRAASLFGARVRGAALLVVRSLIRTA